MAPIDPLLPIVRSDDAHMLTPRCCRPTAASPNCGPFTYDVL